MHNKQLWWLAVVAALALTACADDETKVGDAMVDAGADSTPLDLSPDIQPDFSVSPCGDDATVVRAYDRTMVICESTQTIHSSCKADLFCNTASGWSLCTASQYQARSKASGSKVKAWLRACVRDSNDAPTAPSETLCTCKRVIGTEAFDVDWSCTGVPLHKGVKQHHIGVVTDEVCHRVGENVETTEGYWATQASYSGLNAAVCCR